MNRERIVAKLFTSHCLNALASNDSSTLKKLKINEIAQQFNVSNYHDLYRESYKFLEKNYRNEYVYKNLIARKILIGRHSLRSSVLLSEFRVGTNKADLVLLNGCSTCYEIKTEYDTLSRLEDQLASYSRLFNKVNVVCSSKLIDEIIYKTPENIGIIELTKNNTLKTIREALNFNYFDTDLMMKSLRKEEYLQIAEKIYKMKIDAPNTKIFDLCSEIIKKANKSSVNELFINTLKKSRKNNEFAINSMPKSLTNALISFKFNQSETQALINIFSENKTNVLPHFTRET